MASPVGRFRSLVGALETAYDSIATNDCAIWLFTAGTGSCCL